MASSRADLLRDSLELILERDQQFPQRFYEILFERHPGVVPLFKNNSAGAQSKMLAQMLMAVVDHFDDAEWLDRALGELGAKHREYEVTAQMYDWVGVALIDAIAEGCGADFTAAHRGAWEEGYRIIVGRMCPT